MGRTYLRYGWNFILSIFSKRRNGPFSDPEKHPTIPFSVLIEDIRVIRFSRLNNLTSLPKSHQTREPLSNHPQSNVVNLQPAFFVLSYVSQYEGNSTQLFFVHIISGEGILWFFGDFSPSAWSGQTSIRGYPSVFFFARQTIEIIEAINLLTKKHLRSTHCFSWGNRLVNSISNLFGAGT